jgi:hypothetical protein
MEPGMRWLSSGTKSHLTEKGKRSWDDYEPAENISKGFCVMAKGCCKGLWERIKHCTATAPPLHRHFLPFLVSIHPTHIRRK